MKIWIQGVFGVFGVIFLGIFFFSIFVSSMSLPYGFTASVYLVLWYLVSKDKRIGLYFVLVISLLTGIGLVIQLFTFLPDEDVLLYYFFFVVPRIAIATCTYPAIKLLVTQNNGTANQSAHATG